MTKPTKPFEAWETQDGLARFTFSHSDSEFTTGVLTLQPGVSLPKHNRPHGYESLTQLAGTSTLTVYATEGDIDRIVELEAGDVLRMDKGQWHIHGNESDEVSITFFKLVGDITDIMDVLRQGNVEIELKEK